MLLLSPLLFSGSTKNDRSRSDVSPWGTEKDPITTYGSPPALLGVQNRGASEAWVEEEGD